MMSAAPLRFAIMCNGPSLSRWQLETVQKLIGSGLASPVLIIENAGETVAGSGFVSRLRHYPYRHALYRTVKRFFFNVPELHYLPFTDALKALPVIYCKPVRKGKYSEFFTQESIASVRSYQPDFILRFGFNIIRGEILEVPRYGVWSYHHGDENLFRGGPTGFWELFRKSPVNGVVLQKLNNLIDAGIILSRRSYRSVTHSYSEHLSKILSASTDMPLEVCKKIRAGETDFIYREHSSTSAGMNRLPGNIKMLRFLLLMLAARIRFHLQRLFRQEAWNIAIVPRTGNELLPDTRHPGMKWLDLRNNGSYAADPFVFSRHGKIYLIFEDYDYRVKKGRLCMASYDEQLQLLDEKTILDKPYHLAYPYIFEHGGEIYMMPETAGAGNLQLYRWEDASETFAFVSLLLDVAAVDASIAYINDRWWIFTGIAGDLPNEKLHMFYSDTLTGTYHPHLLNPVKTSPEGSRMAGNIFSRDGSFYRPGQKSVRWYGEAVVLWKIVKLDTQAYEETAVEALQPEEEWKFNAGLHTVAGTAHYFVLDAKRRQSGWVAFWSALKKR